MAKQQVDTPRDGKAWKDVVNIQPLPPTMRRNMTLEGMRDVQRGFSYNGRGEKIAPPKVCYDDPIGDIIEEQKAQALRDSNNRISARMFNR